MVSALLFALLFGPVPVSAVDFRPGRISNEPSVLAPRELAVSPPLDLVIPLLTPDISVSALSAQLPPKTFAAGGLVPGVRVELARVDAEIAQSKSDGVPSLLDRAYTGAPRAPPDTLPVSAPEIRKSMPTQLVPHAPAKPKAAAQPVSEALTRLEINAPFYGVSGSFRVDVSQSGKPEEVTAPQASALAVVVARAMPTGTLKDESVTEIVVVSAMREIEKLQECPTGKVRRFRSADVAVDQDVDVDFRRVYVLRSALKDDFSFKVAPAFSLFKVSESPVLTIPVQLRRRIDPLLQPQASVFVGGLISISAEPSEGFFAAATASAPSRTSIFSIHRPIARPTRLEVLSLRSPPALAPRTIPDRWEELRPTFSGSGTSKMGPSRVS